jgi:UDP-glucose 4-epimerase
VTRPLAGNEAPLSNRKARQMLGFKEQHKWRDELKLIVPN